LGKRQCNILIGFQSGKARIKTSEEVYSSFDRISVDFIAIFTKKISSFIQGEHYRAQTSLWRGDIDYTFPFLNSLELI
jgi:hypothetical protein